MHSDTKPSNGSGSGDATACAHLRAAPPSAICSYVSTPSNSTARSSAGTTNTGGTTQRWPSTARRYATPSTTTAHSPRHERRRPSHQGHLHPKKVGLKPGADDETKRTNEIGTVIPLLDQIDTIAGKTLTADALLTQRKLASYLLERNAHYLFTAKNNQPNLLLDIALHFATERTRPPEFESRPPSPTDASSSAPSGPPPPSTTTSTSPASDKCS